MQDKDIRVVAQAMSIDSWIECVADSLESPTAIEISGIPMPTAPPVDEQRVFVGSSGRQAIREASLFYKYVVESCERHGVKNLDRLLDFGCGWGRYSRLFLREIPEEGLFGVDPQAKAINLCRAHIPQASFIKTESYPPLPFRDQFFDVVIAYSVFSHLSELSAYAWINEIARVLRPGGLLIATTHPIWLLDFVEKLRLGQEPIASNWHLALSKAWMDLDRTRQGYEKGEFLFAGENGEYHEGYGDVIVSPGYIKKVWGKIMEPLDFVAERGKIAQAAFVLRKLRH